jgi:hypothetical protein
VAFDDAILGNDDFDPQAATDELLRRQMGDFPAGSDARGLNTRLLRKLGKAPAPEPASPSAPLARPKQPSPDTPLDLSGFEPVAPDAPATEQQQGQLDLSGFELVEPEKPKTTEQPSYIKEFVKGVAEGVKGMAASSVKGVAAVVPEAGAQPDYDPMGNAVGTNDAMEKGLTPKPMEERLFYRAGKRIDEFGKETLEAAPGFEGSWTRDIGAGFGSMLAGIPVALIPGVGPLVGGTLYTTAGMGEAVENAVKNKASTSQAESAGIAGSVAGATDLIDVMLPFFGGSAGRALGFIKRVGLAAVKGAVTEAGQEGIQQLMQNAIAMGVYKPDQDLFEDVPRSMAIAAIVGGTVAGGSAALHRDSATSSSPPPGPGAPGGAISGPAPGSGPGTPPPGGGRSSPEDIADFVRQANETNPNPPPGPGPTRPQDPATMTDVELMDAFMDIRPDMHGTLKDVLRRTGYADHTIDAMSHRAQVEEAIGVIRMERAEAAKNTQNPPNSEQPTGPQQEGLKPQPDLRHEEYAVLRAYGYTDEDIGSMSYVQRQREFLDAKDEGIDSTAAMKKYPPPVQPKEAEAGGATTSTAGTRAQPIVATTSEDVQKAQPVEPKSEAQAQAENYKHAHVELPVIGLEGKNSISVETGAGQTRSGTAPDGKQWKMVLKHAYGRIKGTKGADGQPLDIVIGPNPQSEHVFVVDQHEPGKGFDEHKIMAGFDTPQQAIVAYAGMYDDQGAGRIGGVKAFTPADFRAWLASGQTSTPLSPEPAAVKGESGATSSTEAGTFPVPKVSSEGVSEVSKDETTTNREGSSEKGVDILGPSPVVAEPSVDHHAQIEAVLGEDYHRVAEVDIQRAAEILAENEGMEPAIAFGQAVAENAVEQGFITEQEAVAAYGEEIQGVLDAGREGTPERGADAVGEGASPEQERAGGAEETGVVPGSSETGPAEDVAAVEAADRQDGEQHDAGRTEPDAERETSGAADEEASGPAEDADNASWWDGLNESDRANLKDSAGLPRKFDLTQPWSLLNSNIQEKLAAARPAFDKNKAAVEEGARDRKAKWSAAEQRASELVKRKDGESDKDYFARLIEASQADDAVPVYNAVRKALEPLMQVEELKPQRPASAKQIEGLRFEIGKTPIGYTTGADWAISGWMGRGGRATVFPDLLSDGEYGYFKTRDEALKHVVEKTIASFESVSKQVNDRVGTDAARRAAATTATFLKTWLTKNLTPPPSPSNSTPTPQPSAKAEAEAVGGKSTLDEAFQNHFATDHGFSGIIEARKFAKDKGFAEDAKSVEEALEFAIVKAARIEVEKGNTPQVTYERLVMLYGRQPRLGTRTSTSVRESGTALDSADRPDRWEHRRRRPSGWPTCRR